MRSFTVLSLLAATATTAVYASPLTGQLPNIAQDVMDWTAKGVSQIGASNENSKNDNGVHASSAWTFVDCGEPDDVIEIKSLRVSPDPPVPGQKMTVYADGTAKSTISEGAYADVVVKLGLIKLINKRFDICEELRNSNATLQCPIEAGDHTIVQVVDLPAEIPKAKFTVNALAYTQPPSMPMACATIIMDFMQRH